MIIIYVFNYIILLIKNIGLGMTDSSYNVMSTAVYLSYNYYGELLLVSNYRS